jgi:hypothetical protein
MDILDPTAPFGVQRTVQDQKMEITVQYVTQDPSNVYLAVKLVIMDQTVHRYAVVRLKPATAAISKTVRGRNKCNQLGIYVFKYLVPMTIDLLDVHIVVSFSFYITCWNSTS